MAKISKTNAVRLLDSAGVEYELIAYEVDESDLAASHVAEQLGEDVRQIFKTLVLRGDRNGIFICVVSGDCEVDLKKAATASGNKSVAMIAMKELLPITGYIRGGCSPIGMKRAFPTYIDTRCMEFDYIYISAGVRGVQIKLDPRKLIDFSGAILADLV